jgi:hypothetical protein
VTYFDPDDADALEGILRELWGSDRARTEMIELGRKRVAAFSWRAGARKSLATILACRQRGA